MFTDEKIKNGLRAWYRLCPIRHTLILVSAVLIFLHLLTRPFRALNVWLSARMVRPAHVWLSEKCANVSFSVAELLIALLVLGLLWYLLHQLSALFRQPKFFLRLYRTLTALLALGLTVYAGFSLLWGVYYYGDDFIAQSGLKNDPVSIRQLERVTWYFADMANTYADRVPRGEDGQYRGDRAALLDKTPEVYRETAALYPCLDGPERRVKGVFCSRVMSYLDFTGFFFPFTGEANVNTDFPLPLFAATAAHELAHQRGVAKEQEANFCAVLACLNYGDPEYVYSAALLAYTHLGNALHSANREAWERIYSRLDESVRADLAAGTAYWAQFNTPVQAASNKVYEGFLQSYDQRLGLKSYGACVDMLVNYYLPEADRMPRLDELYEEEAQKEEAPEEADAPEETEAPEETPAPEESEETEETENNP